MKPGFDKKKARRYLYLRNKGFTYKQIAELMRVKVSSVSKLVYTARKRLIPNY